MAWSTREAKRLIKERSRKDDNGCWIWLRGKDWNGYGRLWYFRLNKGGKKEQQTAYLVSYWAFIGEVPQGLEIDHVCRNRACVNPAHLEAVDHRTNLLRGASIVAENAEKTYCSKGHLFDDKNTYQFLAKYGKGRQCNKCRFEHAVRWRLKNKPPKKPWKVYEFV